MSTKDTKAHERGSNLARGKIQPCRFVQVGRQAMADRYFYTPGIGLLVAVVWSVYALIGLRGRLSPVRLSNLRPI